jgi:hypothetical protein
MPTRAFLFAIVTAGLSTSCASPEPAPTPAANPAKGPPPIRLQPSTDPAIATALASALQRAGATLAEDSRCGGAYLVDLDGHRAAIAVARVDGAYQLLGATLGPPPLPLDTVLARFNANPLSCPAIEVFVGDGDHDDKDEVVIAVHQDRAPEPPFFAVQAFRFSEDGPVEAPEARACLSGASDLPGVHKALGVAATIAP